MSSIIKPPKQITWESLTDEEREAIKSDFETIDKNKNGVIDKIEIRSIIEKRSGLKMSDALVQNFFDTFDLNNDGEVTWEEYKQVCVRQMNEQLLLLMSNKTKTWDDFTPEHQASMQTVRTICCVSARAKHYLLLTLLTFDF